MPEPPDVMLPDIAIAPVPSGDFARLAFEIRKVMQPVVAFAGDRSWIVPVVVAVAIGREVNVTQRSLTRMSLFIADKAFPQIILAG